MKNEILSSIIDLEGGYVNDPSDSGGETMHGITVKVARDHGYFGPMRDLPRSVAMGVYELRYWTPVKGDQLNALSSRVAAEVVDTAINMGTHTASVFLQRSLNVLTKDGVMVDGHIGPQTIAALTDYLRVRDESVLLRALNCLQGSYYIELAEKREKDKRFIYGWLKNRVVI